MMFQSQAVISAAALLDAIDVIKVLYHLQQSWCQGDRRHSQQWWPVPCAVCGCLSWTGGWGRLLWLCSLGFGTKSLTQGACCAPVTHPDEDTAISSTSGYIFHSPSERNPNTSCQTAGRLCLALTHPAPGSLIKPQQFLPRGHGRLLPGAPFGLGWSSPGCPKYVPGAGQAEQAAVGHFDQQELLVECSDILKST